VRTAVVCANVPNPDSGGGAITTWSVIAHLRASGHAVSAVCIHGPVYDDAAGASLERRLRQVRELGAEVVPVLSHAFVVPPRRVLARAVRTRDEELVPNLRDQGAVGEALNAIEPDAVFAYGWDAVAASRLARAPRLGCVVDLAHLPPVFQLRRALRRPTGGTVGRLALVQAMLRRLPRLQVELLNECAASADFARHHAEWLRRKGASGCLYLNTPVWDRVGPEWRAERDRLAAHELPRILLIGHLSGTATQDGLDFFLRDVLPRVERELGPDGFEVRLAGGFDPPPDLRAALERSRVRALGHLQDPDDEFKSADVLVVPTTVPLGARVRIVTGLSFGCPQVIHVSNACGLAELEDGVNCLLGGTAGELADGVVRTIRDRELRRRLEDGGRAAYERWFALPVAGARIEAILSSIARTGSHSWSTRTGPSDQSPRANRGSSTPSREPTTSNPIGPAT